MAHPEGASRPSFPLATRTSPGARVLVLFCHPVARRSRVNRALADAVRELPGVTFHDLYEAYPDSLVDVREEQRLLTAHDTVVLQHPFYWYSTPPLLKEWQDEVLTYGWAYGHGGVALVGKRVLTALTTGGPPSSYQAEGLHGASVVAFLAPIAQTFRLCGMTYLPPLVVQGTHRLDDAGIAAAARRYASVVRALVDDRFAPVADRDGLLHAEASVAARGPA